MALNNIFETGRGGKMHGVNVDFGEKWDRSGNSGWNEDLMCLPLLTDKA